LADTPLRPCNSEFDTCDISLRQPPVILAVRINRDAELYHQARQLSDAKESRDKESSNKTKETTVTMSKEITMQKTINLKGLNHPCVSRASVYRSREC
jgi:hypothetical protein